MSSNASENDIDSDLSGESKFSRVAKWRSSIRSGTAIFLLHKLDRKRPLF